MRSYNCLNFRVPIDLKTHYIVMKVCAGLISTLEVECLNYNLRKLLHSSNSIVVVLQIFIKWICQNAKTTHYLDRNHRLVNILKKKHPFYSYIYNHANTHTGSCKTLTTNLILESINDVCFLYCFVVHLSALFCS